MRCASCGDQLVPNEASAHAIHFQTHRGLELRVWCCTLQCCFWAGVKHARMGAASTAKALRVVFRGSIEVVNNKAGG